MAIGKKTSKKRNIKKAIGLALFICTLLSCVGLCACGRYPYEWEVGTHGEFVENIKKYNSKHDEFVNTFISFNLDSNENVTKQIYNFNTWVTNRNIAEKYGVYDINDEHYSITQVFYLKSDDKNDVYSDYAYKIRCRYEYLQYKFSQEDKIALNESPNCLLSHPDRCYQESLRTSYSYNKEENRIYNSYRHYDILVNEEKFGCIHISSIEEASEEKIDEIIQILLDSMVVLNTEG